MNCTSAVREYVNEIDINMPIFAEDVRKYVTDTHNRDCSEAVRVALFRMAKNSEIKRAYHGVYYKPLETIWGETKLSADLVSRKKYIERSNGDIIGYVTGAKLFNAVGLTRQIPRMTDIATNVHKGKNKYVTDFNVITRKPKMTVNSKNHQYLQFFDLLYNEDDIQYEVDNPNEVILAYFEKNNLNFIEMCSIAKGIRGGRIVIDRLINLF